MYLYMHHYHSMPRKIVMHIQIEYFYGYSITVNYVYYMSSLIHMQLKFDAWLD